LRSWTIHTARTSTRTRKRASATTAPSSRSSSRKTGGVVRVAWEEPFATLLSEGEGSSKTRYMELAGLEPATSWVRIPANGSQPFAVLHHQRHHGVLPVRRYNRSYGQGAPHIRKRRIPQKRRSLGRLSRSRGESATVGAASASMPDCPRQNCHGRKSWVRSIALVSKAAAQRLLSRSRTLMADTGGWASRLSA
jgi:hypothetical protein